MYYRCFTQYLISILSLLFWPGLALYSLMHAPKYFMGPPMLIAQMPEIQLIFIDNPMLMAARASRSKERSGL